MFQPNQKVVCIDDNFAPAVLSLYTALPEEGKVYVVRGIASGISFGTRQEEIAVYLIGIQNPCSNQPPYRERGFKMERFRPLDELPKETVTKEVVYA